MISGQVGVVGAGTMGAGVAQCLAQSGYAVIVVDPNAEARDRARMMMHDAVRLAILLGRGAVTAKPAEVMERVQWTDRIGELSEAGFVIECVPERIDLKEEIFTDLDRHCPPDTIFASCTSAIPIARLAAGTTRPAQVLGLHFMNPAPLEEAVEVVRGPQTSARTMDRALGLLRTMGKEAIVVGDGPGFVLNRVLMLCIAEAAASLDAGLADAETTDAVFEKCLGHPMGPLKTADLIGLDNVADTINVLRELTGDGRYAVPPSLAALVDAGRLGRKTGQGFHDYR
ncbi:MAG: 3-hydroxyacyl-CoA dehydrogenase family protein [Rhodococcus sp. (in: high G+C Gram-positive bacteria)]|uniref:3-hydroxyacyl-CoA dehydrogenase family protein n=1 Tax=Rhodococcus sp. TaxID=1831 RepID=UPI003BAECEE6